VDPSNPSDIEKLIQREVSTLPVDLPSNRRPVIFDRLITVGLRSIRMNLPTTDIAQIRDALIHAIVAIVDRRYRHRLEALEARVGELERAQDGTWREADLRRLRTYHEHGVNVRDLATLFQRSPKDVRAALKGRNRVRP
jgi:hypothetical protein